MTIFKKIEKSQKRITSSFQVEFITFTLHSFLGFEVRLHVTFNNRIWIIFTF